MKQMYISAIVCTLLSGCGSDLDKVKNGVLDFNKTITVGQALDNWKSCESKDWKSFTSDNGVKVVEFTCHHRAKDYFSKLKDITPKEPGKDPTYLDIVDNAQIFQFTLNKDDTFQINAVEVQNTWADGSEFKDAQKPLEQLEAAYENKMHFDLNELNTQTAQAFSYIFAMIKPGEKYKTTITGLTNPPATANPTDNPATAEPAGKIANCDIQSNGATPFHGECNFIAGTGGSFSLGNIDPSMPITEEVTSISVDITGPEIAEVRGLTTGGINSRWGAAKRSTKDRACWTGEDFEICAR